MFNTVRFLDQYGIYTSTVFRPVRYLDQYGFQTSTVFIPVRHLYQYGIYTSTAFRPVRHLYQYGIQTSTVFRPVRFLDQYGIYTSTVFIPVRFLDQYGFLTSTVFIPVRCLDHYGFYTVIRANTFLACKPASALLACKLPASPRVSDELFWSGISIESLNFAVLTENCSKLKKNSLIYFVAESFIAISSKYSRQSKISQGESHHFVLGASYVMTFTIQLYCNRHIILKKKHESVE